MQNDDWLSELQNATTKQLEEWRHKIDDLIAEREKESRTQALQQIHQLAAAHGIALEDLAKGKAKPNRAKSAAPKEARQRADKYRNPDNQFETWSGIGRKPKWVEAQLSAGKSLADLEIKE